MNDQTALLPHSTVTELCGVYQQAEADIRAALGSISAAQANLGRFFDGKGYGFSITRNSDHIPEPDAAIERLHKAVWGALVERLEIRKILSLARIKELDAQLESGEGLPPITVENVLAMLETNLNNAGQYLEEKVRETYEWLRPDGYSLREYKTNQESQRHGVGRKLILGWMVEHSYSGRGFHVSYSRRDNLRALDQVFHLLDGKPPFGQTYNGAVCDAIEAQTKEGNNFFETDYFRGHCFGNRNLHLEIKRADLLDRFNAVAGGARLQDTNPTPKPPPAPRPARTAAPQPTGTADEQIAAVMATWQKEAA